MPETFLWTRSDWTRFLYVLIVHLRLQSRFPAEPRGIDCSSQGTGPSEVSNQSPDGTGAGLSPGWTPDWNWPVGSRKRFRLKMWTYPAWFKDPGASVVTAFEQSRAQGFRAESSEELCKTEGRTLRRRGPPEAGLLPSRFWRPAALALHTHKQRVHSSQGVARSLCTLNPELRRWEPLKAKNCERPDMNSRSGLYVRNNSRSQGEREKPPPGGRRLTWPISPRVGTASEGDFNWSREFQQTAGERIGERSQLNTSVPSPYWH